MSYIALEVKPEQFARQLEQFMAEGGHGVNCTVPLKELAYERADTLSDRARLSGAVNTLMRMENGELFGENTDGLGLVRDLTRNLGLKLAGKRILLLGAGGASRGVVLPILAERPQQLLIANRTAQKAHDLANLFKSYGPVSGAGLDDLPGRRFDIILNATSASLSRELPPLPDELLDTNGICYDLAYGEQPTPFVLWGKDHQARVSVDGLGMLVEQAAEAFLLWRGVRPETKIVLEQLRNKQV